MPTQRPALPVSQGTAAATISGNRPPVQAVTRALEILRLLSDHGALGVRTIGRRLEADKTTVQRTLQTLELAGFVLRDPLSDKFSISPLLFELGERGLRHLALVRQAMPFLREAHQRTGATVLLSTLGEEGLIYVARVPDRSGSAMSEELESASQPGYRAPLHCTAAGKVFLAYMPEAERQRCYERIQFFRATPYTITSAEALDVQLDLVRRQGWAANRQEYHLTTCGIAAPVFGGAGRPVAAIALAAIHARLLDDQRIEELGHIVCKIAERLSGQC